VDKYTQQRGLVCNEEEKIIEDDHEISGNDPRFADIEKNPGPVNIITPITSDDSQDQSEEPK